MTKEMSVQRDRNRKHPNELAHSRITRLFGQHLGISWFATLSGSGADTDRTETEFHSVLQDLRCVIALSETQTTAEVPVQAFAHDT